MNRGEWIIGPQGPLKTDYEHHGMGKTALNVIDPAYDLADTILNLALSPEEENSLIRQYIAESGDTTVEQRLFMHKLLAGLWAMKVRPNEQLFSSHPRGRDAQREYHLRFMNAWNFLTVQTARYCGSLCRPAEQTCAGVLRSLCLTWTVSWTAECSDFLVQPRQAWRHSRC